MIQILRDLLTSSNFSLLEVVVILMAYDAIKYLLKHLFERKGREKEAERTSLIEYERLQVAAIAESYRVLYEPKDIIQLEEDELQQKISIADNLIMRPYTDYLSYIEKAMKIKKLIYGIHFILVQFKLAGTGRVETSYEARKNLEEHRIQFLSYISEFQEEVREYLSTR